MAPNSLSPAFIKVNYTSPYSQHVHTVPTVPIVAGATASGFQFSLRGLALPVDVQAAVEDYIDVLKPFFGTGVHFTDFVAFTQPTPTDIPTPVYSGVLGIVGTASSGIGWQKATQLTMTWRADDFTLYKETLLDCGVDDVWDKITALGSSGRYFDLNAFVTAATTFVASRGGGRPVTFLQAAKTLNEKLRRSYGMN